MVLVLSKKSPEEGFEAMQPCHPWLTAIHPPSGQARGLLPNEREKEKLLTVRNGLLSSLLLAERCSPQRHRSA